MSKAKWDDENWLPLSMCPGLDPQMVANMRRHVAAADPSQRPRPTVLDDWNVVEAEWARLRLVLKVFYRDGDDVLMRKP